MQTLLCAYRANSVRLGRILTASCGTREPSAVIFEHAVNTVKLVAREEGDKAELNYDSDTAAEVGSDVCALYSPYVPEVLDVMTWSGF